MKITNVVKSLEKLGLTVKKEISHNFKDGICTYFYVCYSRENRAEWYEQSHDNGEIISVYICGINQRDDLMTDYFPGSFYQTIKSIVQRMSK